MKQFNLVAVKGQDTFGLSVWAETVKKALAKANRMLEQSGYAVHPAK